MPVVCKDVAGLINITVFFVIKNCRRLLTKKNRAIIKKTPPVILIKVVLKISSAIGICFCMKIAAMKIRTYNNGGGIYTPGPLDKLILLLILNFFKTISFSV